MRRGFTMIELVFVIVILGILAAIAIPRLAASRDDARAVSLKTDIGTVSQAVPAWYQSQNDISIENAMQFDVALWQNTNPAQMSYTFTDSDGGTANVRVIQVNVNNTAANMTETEKTAVVAMGTVNKSIAAATTIAAGNVPWLAIELKASTSGRGVVHMLSNEMMVANETLIPMAGRRVVWN